MNTDSGGTGYNAAENRTACGRGMPVKVAQISLQLLCLCS